MAADAVAEYGRKLPEELRRVALSGAHVHRASIELGKVQDVVDEFEKRIGAQQDSFGIFVAQGLFDVSARKELGEADDRVERRPELVGHHREEPRLRLRVLLRDRRRGVRALRLLDEKRYHDGAKSDDDHQNDKHDDGDPVRKLLARKAEHAVDYLPLRRIRHEHLLEERLVDAGHHLVEYRYEFLGNVRPRKHLELLVHVLRADILCDALRNGYREDGLCAVCR